MAERRQVFLAFSCCNIYCDGMSGKLLKEIHKSRPFDSPQQEAFLNVVRTADHVMRGFEDLLKPFNLSPTQYNVLRILRGVMPATAAAAGAAGDNGSPSPGVPCKTIAEHMLTRDPDITRLLDRMESRGLISRERDTKDRRVVFTRITAEGLRILKELDKPVADYHAAQFPNMSVAKITQLIDLLEQARG